MKTHLRKVLMLCALLPTLPLDAHAIPYGLDAVMTQKITQPLNTATTDDYLIDLARAGGINIIADASDFSATSPVIAFPSTPGAIKGQKGENKDKWGPFLLNIMGDFAAQKKLSTLRPSERTLLFWSEPDPKQLLDQQIRITKAAEALYFAEAVAEGKAANLPEENIVSGELSETRLRQVLVNYLQTRHGWTGTVAQRSGKVDIRTQLDDLPADMRALVLLDMRQKFLTVEDMQWLQDDFWNKGDVRLHTEKVNEDVSLIVSFKVLSDDKKWESSSRIALTKVADISVQPPVEKIVSGPVPEVKEQPEPDDYKTHSFSETYSGITEDSFNRLLEADAALQAPVSLEGKRMSLVALTAELKEQTKVNLSVAAETPPTQLVTLHVANMPLVKLMEMLSRVYGVIWTKGEDETYMMNGNDRGSLHLKLLQIGDTDQYRYRLFLLNRPDIDAEKAAVGGAIMQHVGLEALNANGGIAISALPKPLQNRLRNVL